MALNDKARKDDISRGGSFWTSKRGLDQVNAHISPDLHRFVIRLSEGLDMPINDIIKRCLESLRDEVTRKKVLGTAGMVTGKKES